MKIQNSVDQLLKGFQSIAVTERERQTLIALYQLPEHTGTASDVAKRAGFTHFVEANGCLGRLGNRLAAHLGNWSAESSEDAEPGPGYLFLADWNRTDAGFTWTLRPQVAEALEMLGWVISSISPDQPMFYEGDANYVTQTQYERSPAVRKVALATHGCTCCVCGFDFEAVYGDRGRQYIEMHHLIPLHDSVESRKTDPKDDVVPVCSNCHRMIHRHQPILWIEEMRELISAPGNIEENLIIQT